jgi:hypothetical protein
VVQCSLGRSPFQLEAASDLLQSLTAKGFIAGDVAAEGFLRVLRTAGEMAVEYPRAPDAVARFITRAMADGVLPSDFLATLPPPLGAIAAAAATAPGASPVASGASAAGSLSPASSYLSAGASAGDAGGDASALSANNQLARQRSAERRGVEWVNVRTSEAGALSAGSSPVGSPSPAGAAGGLAAAAAAASHSPAGDAAGLTRAATAVINLARALAAQGAATPGSEAARSIWGYRGRTVHELRAAINTLARTFVAAPSTETYCSELAALGCRELHAEAVRSVTAAALAAGGDASPVAALLARLYDAGIVSEIALRAGLARVVEDLEFNLDQQVAAGPGNAAVRERRAAVQAHLLSVLVQLARAGALDRTFFASLPSYVLNAAQSEAAAVDAGSEDDEPDFTMELASQFHRAMKLGGGVAGGGAAGGTGRVEPMDTE